MKRFAGRSLVIWATYLSVAMPFAVGSVGHAAIVGTKTLMRDPSIGLPFVSPDTALPEPYVSYALGINSTGGVEIQAVEVNINGQLHQRWTDTEGVGAFAATGDSTNKSNGDSHLLALPQMLFASGPTEDNPGTGSPLSGNNNDATLYGIGSNLSGVFGTPGQGVKSLEVAYIVIPKNSDFLFPFNVDVTVLNANGDIYAELDWSDFVETLPTAQVKGASMVISNGDTTPRAEDNTDYGLDPVGVSEIRPFVLENTGTVPLSLGVPTFTGPFALTGTLPATINPGGSASFSVRLTRDAPGNFLGSMSFMSNAGQYTFALAGQAVPEPTSAVLCGAALVGFLGIGRRKRTATFGSIYQ